MGKAENAGLTSLGLPEKPFMDPERPGMFQPGLSDPCPQRWLSLACQY